ncbi:MAG: nucleoside recognition domain-containing protein, partial [Bradymonadaceae bacterium]
MSERRWQVDWELVTWGVGLQLTFAGLIFLDPWGQQSLFLGMFLAWALAGEDVDIASAAGVAVAGAVMLNPWVQPMIAGAETGFLSASGLGIYALFFAFVAAFLVIRETDPWLVAAGIALQVGFALLLYLGVSVQGIFDFAGAAVNKLLEFTDAGSKFLFKSYPRQEWAPALKNFAFQILPTIIFFSSLMTILYYLGVMQWVVRAFARLMRKTMGISGAESLSASANIFVGQTEAPLVIKPYVENMTKSELMVVMTGGFATVAGGVMAIYVGMLSSTFPNIAKHLIAASVMSAPA